MADFKMPDLGGLMQAAQNMQREMQRVQEGLASKQVEAAAGGGMVTVVANGQLQVLSVKTVCPKTRSATVSPPVAKGVLYSSTRALVSEM